KELELKVPESNFTKKWCLEEETVNQYDTGHPELLFTSKSPSRLIVGKQTEQKIISKAYNRKINKSTDPSTNMGRSFNR
ncbi:7984_t:CDS:2, partial [Gigaspora rosea]